MITLEKENSKHISNRIIASGNNIEGLIKNINNSNCEIADELKFIINSNMEHIMEEIEIEEEILIYNSENFNFFLKYN